ncbi:HlyD family secretion protein [Neorhodopirellula lusitana]|uniref:HlyD family secretion protein n=1 Tax=Neorhodopirellula lusitana TaxID=445327 RepID=A0ABY1PRY4_9BACT|nr:efflux RND transporter periplasmic adaptor subunit [Neorhodopirellula lusitana]SMP44271.1 HlyD family secretion protein [Neorhodopirellula lusitana]
MSIFYKLLAAIGFCILVVLLMIAGKPMFGQQDGTALPPAVARTHVRVAATGSIAAPDLQSTFRGEIRARRQSELSIRRSGLLAEVLVHEGDRVIQGEVLARLNMSDLDVREQMADAEVDAATATATEAVAGPRYQTLNAAAARVRQLKAKLNSAKNSLDRQRQLSTRQVGTAQELDEAEFMVAELEASLAASTAELEELNEGTRSEQILAAQAKREAAIASRNQLRVDRQDSQIIAPYSGVIANRFVDEGEMVSPGQPVLMLLEADPVEAHFGVPVNITAGWETGSVKTITVNDRPFQGTLVRMQPQVDSVTRTRGVDFEIAAPQGQPDLLNSIFIGQTATLNVPFAKPSSSVIQDDGKLQFWTPTNALIRGTRGLWSVYIAASDSDEDASFATIARRDVRVVQTAGPLSRVEGFVRPGEWLVTGGVQRLGPGVPVQIATQNVDNDIAPATLREPASLPTSLKRQVADP